MWKLFILFLLAPLRIILTQPVVNENIRSPRQLNFEECCPCLNSGSSKSHDLYDDTMEKAASADNCPCRVAPDSESASSIFTPAFRAVEPLIRSVKEKHPKPLLNPEVGLASSVLETLRQVTDQEYQEALVRDAARNSRKDIDENMSDDESTLNNPKNIVNIILQRKEEDKYDTLPEASHVQETRCITPNKKTANSFDFEKLKVSNKPLRNYSPLTTGISGKRYFDMANSASNMQELAIPPLKNNLLENYKTKSDLLKMKLFPNSKHSFKEANTDFDASNQLNKHDYSKSRTKQVPNFKLPSIFDLINASKQNKLSSAKSTLKESDTNDKIDFMTSPSHHENYYLRNNVKSPKNNAKLSMSNVVEPQQPILYLKESSKNDKSFEIEQDLIDVPSPTNLKTNKDITNLDFMDKNNNQMLKNYNQIISKGDDTDNIDTISSPSEINLLKEPLDKITDNENYTNKNFEISDDICTTDNKDVIIDIQKQSLLNENVPEQFEDTTTDDSEMITTNVESDNIKNESSEENVCDVEDSETGASNDNLQIINKDQENNEEIGEPNVRENELLNDENSFTTTTEVVTKNDLYRTSTKSALSNIKKDIFKTFENVKKINENIRENLKSNVHNTFKSDDVDNNSYIDVETTTHTSLPTNIVTDENVNVDDKINTQDLQQMSDRLLSLSESDSKEEMQGLDSKDVVNTISKTDFNSQSSELNSIVLSTTSSFQTTESTVILEDSVRNFNEIVDEVDDIHDSKEKNENPCQSIPSKMFDQAKVSLPNDPGKEMISEASSPIVNSVPYTSSNGNVQPNLKLENQKPNVRTFLDNFKSSISGIFNDNKDANRNVINYNEQPVSESRNVETFKSFSNKLAENHLSMPNKINNLNSYKAKVATPDSLKIKTMPSLTNRKENTLQRTLKKIPEIRSENKGLRDYLEKPTISSQTRNAQREYNPRLNLQNPHLTSFSENLKSRTDEALKSIQNSFDDFHNSHINNRNNILGKIPINTNMLRNSESKDLNKRLQDFNSDLITRLSQMSQRIQDASILSSHESPIFQAKNKLNNGDRLSISKPTSHVKNNFFPKSKQNPGIKSKIVKQTIDLDNKSGILKNAHTLGENLRKIGEKSKLKTDFKTKPSLKKDYMRKPLKDSKLDFPLFTSSERPNIMKSRSNSKLLNKPLPPTLRSNLPKTMTQLQSPLQKRLELMSKLKPLELQPLASDRHSSRIALPNSKIDNEKLSSSSLEESMIQPFDDIIEKSSKADRFPKITNIVTHDSNENFALSKIRNAIRIQTPNTNINKKFMNSDSNNLKSTAILDPSQSASNNMNTVVSSVMEKPLKENVSYKCKMVCYEDDSQINNR